MVTSHARGNKIYYDGKDWRYSEDDTLVNENEKPCARCGRMPTKEGYDACLGYIEGATSACCGHGVEPGYVLRGDNLLSISPDATIYLSGPITGTDDAAERFGYAAKQLKLLGFKNIINPQRLCDVFTYEAKWEAYMDMCIACLNKHVDVIYMLKGWKGSKGAKAERDLAISKGIEIVYEDWPEGGTK